MRKFKVILSLMAAAILAFPASGLAEVHPVETRKYNKVVQIVWTDDNGNAVPGPDGYAVVRYSYPQGYVTERYYEVDGETPYRMPDGSFGISRSIDGKGQVTEIIYLDAEGRKVMNDYGYARVRMDYTSFGEMRSLRFYGTGKNCVTVPSLGFARMEVDFSGKSMTSRVYMNEREQPVDTVYGYAAVRQKLNKKHQVIRRSYEHADGNPATCEDGWSSCEFERDAKGRVTCIKYYDEQGRMTDRGAGYAYEQTEYLDDGSVRVTRYDLSGQKVTDEDGVTTWRREYKDDRIVRESFLNASGERILNGDGVGAVRYDYDNQGRITEVRYEDLSGKGTLSREGYAGYRDQLDADGRTENRTFLGTDGKAMALENGCTEVRFSYSETGEMTAVYYDGNGQEIATD